jgi:hypothetical protein
MQGNSLRKALILGGLFIVLVCGGRMIFLLPKSTAESQELNTQPTPKPSPELKPQSVTSKPTSVASEESIASCAERLTQETTAAKKEYDKGTILVTFKSGLTYEEAKALLATYGIRVQSEASAQTTYENTRLITGALASGEEFTKICLIKRDQRIAYAGLNVIFNLHE